MDNAYGECANTFLDIHTQCTNSSMTIRTHNICTHNQNQGLREFIVCRCISIWRGPITYRLNVNDV